VKPMKFPADENLPLSTVKSLKDRGTDIISIRNYGSGLKDEEAIRIAARENRILITLEKDFGEMVFRKGKKCVFRFVCFGEKFLYFFV
jgi:predicted nuclease of predicted toxin-antitoxin system